MNRRNVVRALWIAAMLLVLATGLIPMPPVRDLPSNFDKFVHLSVYAVLGLLAVLAQRGWHQRVWALAAMVVFGIVVELLQGRLPWRSFEWMDIVANFCGVLLGGLFAMAWRSLRARRRRQRVSVHARPQR